MKYMTALEELNLSDNNITNLSFLSDLTNIKKLNISNSNYFESMNDDVIDISVLGKLHELKELDISGNRIVSLEPLIELKNLRVLNVSNNMIDSFDAIKVMSNLEQLDISNNPADTLEIGFMNKLTILNASRTNFKDQNTGLKKLDFQNDNFFPNLKELNLCKSNLGPMGLSGIKSLAKLEILDVSACNISDLTDIGELTNLKKLSLYNNSVENVNALINLRNLEYLHLGGNLLNDLSPLTILEKLEYLDLSDRYSSAALWESGFVLYNSNKKFTNIMSLGKLKNVTNLHLNNNNIIDIHELSKMKQLKYLYLGCNNIDDITALSALSNLRRVDLSWNKVNDLTPIAYLPLEYLDVSGNELLSIKPLKDNTELKELYCGTCYDMYEKTYDINSEYYVEDHEMDNQSDDINDILNYDIESLFRYRYNFISDLSPLANLKNLTCLNLDGNPITDISPLSNLYNLKKLSIVSDFSVIDNWTPVEHVPEIIK